MYQLLNRSMNNRNIEVVFERIKVTCISVHTGSTNGGIKTAYVRHTSNQVMQIYN